MGRKIRPDTFRLGITDGWDARWLSMKHTPEWLEEDGKVRKIIMEKISQAGIAKIETERTPDKYKIYIKASRPGLIIGRGGKGIEELTKLLEKAVKSPVALSLNIEELKRTEVSANQVAQSISWDLEKRIKFRRTLKKYLDVVTQNKDVQGAKVMVAGRLDGGEIARREHLQRGKLPLGTLRALIDYGTATAFTTYGAIGIKVWIYKGEKFEERKRNNNANS